MLFWVGQTSDAVTKGRFVQKFASFDQKSRFISETIQDKSIVSVERQLERVCDL